MGVQEDIKTSEQKKTGGLRENRMVTVYCQRARPVRVRVTVRARG